MYARLFTILARESSVSEPFEIRLALSEKSAGGSGMGTAPVQILRRVREEYPPILEIRLLLPNYFFSVEPVMDFFLVPNPYGPG